MGDTAITGPHADRQEAVDAHPFWYHTLDLGDGVVTPGHFDLRAVVDRMPWPDLRGKRCLDIGTYDGFLAFEMERRGAGEVVAIDIEDHELWDWPPDYRSAALHRDVGFAGPPKGAGFRLAAQLSGSRVEWRPLSVYDLSPEMLGIFDVVACGSLLLHLRDPLRALEAVRSVTGGHFLSSEQIELWPTVLARRRPLFTLNGSGRACQWFNFNAAGHERMLFSAGFEVVGRSRPFVVAFNRHPMSQSNWKVVMERSAQRALTGQKAPGVLHRALLGRPRV